MDTWIRINESTVGKDKLFRVLQYTLKLVAGHLQSRLQSADLLDTLLQLEKTISFFRRTLRLGKCAQALRRASRSRRYGDPLQRLTLTLAAIAQCMQLVCDHVLWLSHVPLLAPRLDTAGWNNLYHRCWLYSVLMRVCRDVHELRTACCELSSCCERANSSLIMSPLSPSGNTWSRDSVLHVLHQLVRAPRHRALLLDTAANTCDLLAVLAWLGHVPVSQRVATLLALVASSLQLATIINPRLALRP